MSAPAWLAKAIALAIAALGSVGTFTADETRAIMVVTAHDEGRFCSACARGDHEQSVTTWQIRRGDEAARVALERDPALAARVALWTMKESARLCPAAPLAPYAGGCASVAARRVSDDRIKRAMRLAHPERNVTP